MELIPSQQAIVNEAIKWWRDTNDPVFQFEGPPGTGKSVVLNAIKHVLDPLEEKSAAAAYTGAAAIVMRTKGFENAKSLHSLLYSPTSVPVYDKDNNPVMDKYYDTQVYETVFVPKPLEGDIELLFIDESGTVPMYMRRDIESRGIRVVACGDIRQLPSIEDEPAYLTSGTIYHLTEIMRQCADNAIVWLSQRLINGLPIHKGNYGNVLVIQEDELTPQMISAADVVLCGKNVTRDKLNNDIRHNIIKATSILPGFGERLVCRKNNWYMDLDGICLANGLVGSVVNYPDTDGFDGKVFNLDFLPNIMSYPFQNIKVDYKYFTAPYTDRPKIKQDKFSFGDKFEYAYALTTHLAQGSEWSSGIYIQEYLHKDINANLNYVGISRFRDYCIYVIPKPKYYYSNNNRV